MKTFEEAWARMEAKGYQYGSDALEQVRFGWELHEEETKIAVLQKCCEDYNEDSGAYLLPDNFIAVIQAALNVFTASELASKFEVAESTIKRWANGTSDPHPKVKKFVVSMLQKMLK